MTIQGRNTIGRRLDEWRPTGLRFPWIWPVHRAEPFRHWIWGHGRRDAASVGWHTIFGGQPLVFRGFDRRWRRANVRAYSNIVTLTVTVLVVCLSPLSKNLRCQPLGAAHFQQDAEKVAQKIVRSLFSLGLHGLRADGAGRHISAILNACLVLRESREPVVLRN